MDVLERLQQRQHDAVPQLLLGEFVQRLAQVPVLPVLDHQILVGHVLDLPRRPVLVQALDDHALSGP